MSDSPLLLQNDSEAAVTVAVLYERTATLGREVREMKDAQREQMAELRAQNKTLNDKLDGVLEKMNQAQGGWRTLMIVGGAAAALSGAVTWVLSHVITIGTRT